MEVTMITLLVLFVVTLILNHVQSKRASRTTYDELMEHSRELIDKGQYDKLRTYLSAHTKLLIEHYDELFLSLSDYARSRSDMNNKN